MLIQEGNGNKLMDMAKFENRDGSGILFHNDKKTTDRHPNWKGTARFNGQDLDISIWVKQGKKGDFLSLAIEKKSDWEPGPKQTPAQIEKQVKQLSITDEEVPF